MELKEATERQAYRYAKRKHDDTGAIRKHSGLPYIVHPEGVAMLAKAYGGSDDEIAAAYLHDTVEDAGVIISDIDEKFGPGVADIVSQVTNDAAEVKRLGKEKYISKELSELTHPALFVKLCDILYNCLDYPSESQLKRMLNNVTDLVNNRDDITDKEWELIYSIFETEAAA